MAHSGSSRLTARNGDVLEKSAEVPALTGVRTLFEDILALRWDLRLFSKAFTGVFNRGFRHAFASAVREM